MLIADDIHNKKRGHKLTVEHEGRATRVYLDGMELRRVMKYSIEQDEYGCELTVKIIVDKEYVSRTIDDEGRSTEKVV